MILALLGPAAFAQEPLAYGLHGVDLGCAACERLGADQVRVEASSTLPGGYATSNLLDGKAATAWCEGADGPGVGATLRLSWPEPRVLYGLGLRGGYFKSEALLRANARPRTLRVRTSAGQERRVELADPAAALSIDPSLPPAMAAIPAGSWFARARDAGPPVIMLAESPDPKATSTWVELTILEVWPGSKYADLCASEILVWTIDPGAL